MVAVAHQRVTLDVPVARDDDNLLSHPSLRLTRHLHPCPCGCPCTGGTAEMACNCSHIAFCREIEAFASFCMSCKCCVSGTAGANVKKGSSLLPSATGLANVANRNGTGSWSALGTCQV